MPPLSESQLVRRVFELREAHADSAEFSRELTEHLAIPAAEAAVLAEVLADRFVSRDEQLHLLGRLDLRGALDTNSSPAGFIRLLAGADGNEALRHHARHLVNSLGADSRGVAEAATAEAAIEELTALLPRALGTAGGSGTVGMPGAVGIYLYLRPEDSVLRGLVAELQANWRNSADPALRVRSARVLAGLGDRAARDFMRDTAASFATGYRGELTLDERIARAAGLAVDGDPAASRFLQNVAMDPHASTVRRYRALSYLRPESLALDADVPEVFRSLVEDPEEPVPTRYLMLLLLARSPQPPDSDWWRARLADPSMVLSDGATETGGAASSGSGEAADSEWHLVLQALSQARETWAGELLLEFAGNSGVAPALRREAAMAYIAGRGIGSMSWEIFAEVFAAGDRPLGELRLRFPHRAAGSGDDALFDLRRLGFIEKEYVLNLRETGMGTRIVDFRPFAPARDALSPAVAMPDSEFLLPRNRRVTLWPEAGADEAIPEAEVALLPYDDDAEAAEAAEEGGVDVVGEEPASRSNSQVAAVFPHTNHRQNTPGGATSGEVAPTHNEEFGI